MSSSRRTVISDPSSSTHASAPQQKKSKQPQHKKHPAPSVASPPNALLGVQKIKAALRQTRRLLAKDTLAADVRVATERRLKSLEGDLTRAEQARVERTMATRYHKAKFFERRKVTRKIAQTKKQLEGVVGNKERKKLEARLAELRVDLNYILHYPKTKKYISLFPPEARRGEREGKAERKDRAKEEVVSETDRQREEVRRWMRVQMGAGAMSAEPEVELRKENGTKSVAGSSYDYEEKAAKSKDASQSPHRAAKRGIADDEFFASVDEENGDEGQDASGDESEAGEDSEMDED